jgi:hypothetical protein
MTITHENGAAEAPTRKAAKKGGKSKQESELAVEASSSAEPEAPAHESPQEPEPTPKPRSRKAKRIEEGSTLTMGMLAERYLEHLEAQGKSHGTLFSYGMEIRVAARELGSDTLIASLTPEQVQGFFDSAKVTKLKSGRPKAKPSIDKTRRVLRLALHWAVEQRWLEKAPLPDSVESK